jgi:IS5 family transposase
MKATLLIRKHGLKVRMEEPEEFLKRMNQLCIRMTHARRKKDGKRVRKAVLREMKKLSKIIAAHAERHREVLEKRWQETELKEGEARQILERIAMVVEQLPAAIRQAHERIIGERQVKNEEKILSLYEGQASVYVRGKAEAEVEFGSQLLLGESQSGVIVDWELVDGNPQADTKMLRRSLERLKQTAQGQSISAVGGDRGFDSKPNRAMLEQEGIFNGICPKAPDELKKRMKELQFVELQKRRSQTEARIAIFKNGFLGSPLLSKGQKNQEREVGWNVLTHNLWVIARQPRAKVKAKPLLEKAS